MYAAIIPANVLVKLDLVALLEPTMLSMEANCLLYLASRVSMRVLSLSKRLGVTRGSFYWHFASHADLIEALWARWYARELAVAQQLRSHTTDRPKDDLMHLVQVALAHAGEDLQNMRFELA